MAWARPRPRERATLLRLYCWHLVTDYTRARMKSWCRLSAYPPESYYCTVLYCSVLDVESSAVGDNCRCTFRRTPHMPHLSNPPLHRRQMDMRLHHRWRLKPHFQAGDPCYFDSDKNAYSVAELPEKLRGLHLMQILTSQACYSLFFSFCFSLFFSSLFFFPLSFFSPLVFFLSLFSLFFSLSLFFL